MINTNFGLIGLGTQGSKYAYHILNDVDGADLIAVCGRREPIARRFARNYGIKSVYSDYKKLLKDKNIDAVVIATPPKFHSSIAVEAAMYEKNIIVEKPFSMNSEEADDILKAVERAGVNLTVSHLLRYDPIVDMFYKKKGEIGEIGCFSLIQAQGKPRQKWQKDMKIAGGGVMLDIGVHHFDLISYILGDILYVYCNTDKRNMEDSFSATVFTKDHACFVSVQRNADTPFRRLLLVGKNGHLNSDLISRNFLMRKGQKTETERIGSVKTIKLLLNDFVNCIRSDTTPLVTGLDGLKSIKISEACYRSARSNKIEKV